MTVGEIIEAALPIFGVRRHRIASKARKRREAWARFAIAWAARQLTNKSYAQIAREMRRDHSTIIYGIARAEQLRRDDPLFRKRTDALLAKLSS